jgi:protein-tyrosine phosphatase
MVEIHCHILPEVDDGAWDMEAAVAMAKIARDSGVKKIITTPHFKGEPAALGSVGLFRHQLRLLQSRLKREKIEVELLPGAEVLCVPQTMELAQTGRLPTLGTGRYVLTEFYFDASAGFMDETLHGLRQMGYLPVVAHPERYGAVQRDPELSARWFHRGIVLQVNKGSVLGAFGRRAEDAAVRMLCRGNAHIIASDAHSPEVRTTDLQPVRHWCMDHLGQAYTKILLEDNPGRIAAGKPMCKVR